MIPEERCSCNARLKHKCCKESVLGGGKMCVKELKEEAVPIPVELIDRIQVIHKKAEDNIALETAKQILPEYDITSAEFVDDVLRIEARLPGSIQYVHVTGEVE